jgi:hypothetical protein
MIPARSYVATAAIRRAISGCELDVLTALGIQCCGSRHIHCPYPFHEDKHPSWRWDVEKNCAYCTCTRCDSIFDVICKIKGIDFEAAKIVAAEIIGRTDLIRAVHRRAVGARNVSKFQFHSENEESFHDRR